MTGRVLDSDGRPIPDTLVEIWQANAAGRYQHAVDDHPAPLDPNFTGVGRCVTDSEGRYRFVTIKPGSYPWRNHPNAWRPAHIHFSLFGRAFTQRLVTQMYFPGDPLFFYDPIFNSVPEAARDRLISRFDLGPDRAGMGARLRLGRRAPRPRRHLLRAAGRRMMRQLDAVSCTTTPQPPGRTPHSASRRASGTTQPQAPLRCPGGETLLSPGAGPRTPLPPEASGAPAREARKCCRLFTPQGHALVAGMALVIIGILLCAVAGSRRERDKAATAQQPGGSRFWLGLLICVLSGIFSPMLNFSFVFGKDLQALTLASGAAPAMASPGAGPGAELSPTAATVFTCFRKTGAGDCLPSRGLHGFLAGQSADGGALVWRHHDLRHWSRGTVGALGGMIGWPLFMATIIITANLWGSHKR